ncbi:MAG: tRNA (adenosine(37)-N6)-dimethylallyltransferase MiaA [Litoreibacter sp.]
MLSLLTNISRDTPVLIAGPTASGKSALAMAIAKTQGGRIINADALQVFSCWQALSARPGDADLAVCEHALYGHVPYAQTYSTGQWLREITPLLNGPRPIIVGGTGLNFTALTEGLATIPPIPEDIRAHARQMTLTGMLDALDQDTKNGIDVANPARVRRAFEVQRATGQSIRIWQQKTPPPLLPLSNACAIVLDAPKEWLTPRIEKRFDLMLEAGALDEARALLDDWDESLPASKAIGGPELIAYLRDEISLETAKSRAYIATRQYAKRQRSWFRVRMKSWTGISAAEMLL